MVGLLITELINNLLLSLSVNFFKSVIIWQSYKQESRCLVHFLRLSAVWWPDARSARDTTFLLQLC